MTEPQAGVASGIKAQAQLCPLLRALCWAVTRLEGSPILQWQWLVDSGLGAWVQTLWPSESLRGGERQCRARRPCCHPQDTENPRSTPREWGEISFHPEAKEGGCEHSRVWLQEGAELDHPSDLGRGTHNPRRPQEVQGIAQSLKASLAMWLREGKSQLCSLRKMRDSWQSSLIGQASGALLGR